jgi:hypothetical protein
MQIPASSKYCLPFVHIPNANKVQPAANSPTAKFLILVPSPPELPVKHVDIQALENYFHPIFDF